jgi:hypothetical protein
MTGSDESTSSGIAKLDDDVLRVVFTFAETIDPLLCHLVRRRLYLGWVMLSHVSRRWRTILLGMGELWARNVCVIPSAHINTFLSRSGNWPIKLSIHHGLAAITVIDALIMHMERVGELRWSIGTSEEFSSILDGKSMPRLRSLELISNPSFGWEPGLKPLRLHVPELREVTLSEVDAVLYGTNIRFLSLKFPPQSPVPLLEMLSASTHLEYLKIDFNISPTQQWDIEGNTIHLPNLGKLSLTSNTRESDQTILALLRRLCFPDGVCIKLQIDGDVASGNTVAALMDALSPFLQFHSRDTITIRTECSSWYSSHHSFVLHNSSQSVYPRPRNVRVNFPRPCSNAGQHPDAKNWIPHLNHLLRLLSSDSCDRITQLELASLSDSEINSSALSAELRRFTHTTTMHFNTDVAGALVTCLLAPESDLSSTEDSTPSAGASPRPSNAFSSPVSSPRLLVPFPALKMLKVHLKLSDADTATAWWHVLNRALERRPAPLARLVLLVPPPESVNGQPEGLIDGAQENKPMAMERAVEAHRRGIARARMFVREVVDETGVDGVSAGSAVPCELASRALYMNADAKNCAVRTWGGEIKCRAVAWKERGGLSSSDCFIAGAW